MATRRQGGDRDQRPRRREREVPEFDERIVDISRTAKVLKGGRRFAFRVLVVVGDNKGRVGVAVGKAREVPEAVRKGLERAKRDMIRVPMVGQTIPHPVIEKFAASKMRLSPAAPGTGVIAGRGARAVLEAAGVRDILTKNHGSSNILNVTLGTFEALRRLKSPADEAERRGIAVERVMPFWSRSHVK